MRPVAHIAASLGLSLAAYYYFRSLACAILLFSGGALIDIDHLFDFIYNHELKNFKNFFQIIYACNLRYVFLLLHSFELVILLWTISVLTGFNKYILSFSVGITVHMLMDQISNPVTPRGYFLLYRLMHGFKAEGFYKKELLEKRRM